MTDTGKISDGYHTFDELYDFRMLYHAAFCNSKPELSCKSRVHSSGEACFGGGWFIVTTQLPTGQISNHYRDVNLNWDLFKVRSVPQAPPWDGHTSADVVDRLKGYLMNQ